MATKNRADDGIKTFPPNFDANKEYPPEYNLEQIDVYSDAEPGKYFSITGLPDSIGYGKHSFTIDVSEPAGESPLKHNSHILIEAKDVDGTVIYTSITDVVNLNGSAVAYLWIKSDPLRTKKNIRLIKKL